MGSTAEARELHPLSSSLCAYDVCMCISVHV